MKNISWELDQNIYPEHFQNLERKSLITNIDLLSSFDLNFIGVIEFELEQKLYLNNIIKFNKLKLITYNKSIVDVDNNAIINILDLNNELTNISENESLFIGINFSKNIVVEEHLDKYDDTIKFETYQMNLGVAKNKSFDIYLGQIINNKILFNSSFPFVKFKKSEYCLDIISKIKNMILSLKNYIKENISHVEIAEQIFLNTLRADLQLFEYYFNQSTHTKIIFDKLLEIYIKSINFFETNNFESPFLEYNHFQQRSLFIKIIQKIDLLFKNKSDNHIKKYFQKKGGCLYLDFINPEEFVGHKVIISSDSESSIILNELKNTKISCIERLDQINMLAIDGIKVVRRINHIEIDFFNNLEELEYVKKYKNIAFNIGNHENEKFYLKIVK